MFDLLELKPDHFENLIGRDLPLVGSDFSLTITSVQRLKSHSSRAAPFSLNLLAPANVRGVQGVYKIEHPEIGLLEMFLVPVATFDGRLQFEAVFN
ncbi:MAG: hypothetical protein ABI451_00365 [Dokdonella sp.]